MWVYNYDYLIHHGIPGMKWGVRRYQKKDGSLTSAGRANRKNNEEAAADPTSKKKSNYRQKLEEKYISKGLSPENAAKAADNRIKTQKILGITAGVTVAAASAYLITKGIKERKDQIIKVGDTFQRIEGQKYEPPTEKSIFGFKKKQTQPIDLDKNLHEAFYATNTPYDNANYEAAFGYQKKNLYNKAYKLSIEATADMKIASQKKAKDIFKKLLYEDDDFINSLYGSNVKSDLRGEHAISPLYIEKIAEGKSVPSRIIKKMYENYNSQLVGKSYDSIEERNRNIFYEALRKQGYSGIQDINDLKWSSLRGKNPLIIFDKSSVSVKKIEDICDKVSKSASDKAYNRMTLLRAKQYLNSLLPTLAASTLVSLSYSFISPLKSSTRSSKIVQQYKREHPNTTLTDAQIKQMYLKDLEQKTKQGT